MNDKIKSSHKSETLKDIEIVEKKRYSKPEVSKLGSMQRFTLGGSNLTSQDSETGDPGPWT